MVKGSSRRGFCVLPLPCWNKNTTTLAERLLVTKRNQLLPHVPFASIVAHIKVLSQLRTFRENAALKIQNQNSLPVFLWKPYSLERRRFTKLGDIVDWQLVLNKIVGNNRGFPKSISNLMDWAMLVFFNRTKSIFDKWRGTASKLSPLRSFTLLKFVQRTKIMPKQT